MIYNVAFIAIILTQAVVHSCPYLDSLKRDAESATKEEMSKWSRFLRSADSATEGKPKENLLNVNSNKASICAAYKSLKSMYDNAYPPDSDILGQSNIVGKAVRLVWHDGGEYDKTSSDKLGMDGCLSRSGANKGLLEADGIVATVFEPMYRKISDKITKADFIAMIGKIAVEKSAVLPMKMPFYYGRNDVVDCEAGAGRLPNAQDPAGEFKRVFEKQLGFTTAEAGILLIKYILQP
jgi:catalase (peroxidase I)